MNYDLIMDYVYASMNLLEETRTVKACGREELFDSDQSHVNELNVVSAMTFEALTRQEFDVARHLIHLISVMEQERPDPEPWRDEEYPMPGEDEAYMMAMEAWQHNTTLARLEYAQITRYLQGGRNER